MSILGGKINVNHGENRFTALDAADSQLAMIDGLALLTNTAGVNGTLNGIVLKNGAATISGLNLLGAANTPLGFPPSKRVYDTGVMVSSANAAATLNLKQSVLDTAKFGVTFEDAGASGTISRTEFVHMVNRALWQKAAGPATTLLFENNLVHQPNTGDWLVFVRKGTVRFNTVDCNATAGWGIYSASGVSGDVVEIAGNIVLACTGANIVYNNNPDSAGYKDIVRFNIAFANTQGCNYLNQWNATGCLDSNSLPSQHGPNYDLNPVLDVKYRPGLNSPPQLFDAIDTAQIGAPEDDRDGRPRIGHADIGAFEVPLLLGLQPTDVEQGQGNISLTINGINLSSKVDVEFQRNNGTDTSLSVNPLSDQSSTADGKSLSITLVKVDDAAPVGLRDLLVTVHKGTIFQAVLTKKDALNVKIPVDPGDASDASNGDGSDDAGPTPDVDDAGTTQDLVSDDTGPASDLAGDTVVSSDAGDEDLTTAEDSSDTGGEDLTTASDTSDTTTTSDTSPNDSTDSLAVGDLSTPDQTAADSAPSSDTLGDDTTSDIVANDSGDDSQAPLPDATVGETSPPPPDVASVSSDATDDADASGIGGNKGSSTSKGGGCAAAPQPGRAPLLLTLFVLGWLIRRRACLNRNAFEISPSDFQH